MGAKTTALRGLYAHNRRKRKAKPASPLASCAELMWHPWRFSGIISLRILDEFARGLHMMNERNQVLITEEGYEGKYVVLRSISDRTVVASGNDPETVMQEARKQGIANPVIFFVPSHDITLVY